MIDPASKHEWACPLNGQLCIDGSRQDFPKDRVGNTVKCRWWQHVAGKDPQSEKVVDQADCAIAWLPTVGIENSQMSRQTAASVDKVANQVSEIKLGLSALSGAVRVAGASIAQAVDAGALTVMLPSPNDPPEKNGNDREIKEGDKP